MNQAISRLRVFSMIFIVAYHCICYYGVWTFQHEVLYSNIQYWRSVCEIALNMFVFISGFLFANSYLNKNNGRGLGSILKKKVTRLLIPLIVWSIVSIVLFPCEKPVLSFFCGVYHLWFLMMLFGTFVVSAIFVRRLAAMAVPVQFLVVVFFVLLEPTINRLVRADTLNLFRWREIVHYLPSFLTGFLMVSGEWEEKINKLSPVLSSFVVIISLSLAVYIAGNILPLSGLYSKYPMIIFFVFVYTILHCYISRPSTVILSLDRCSMGIYIIHHILIWGIIYYIPSSQALMKEHYIIAPLILFIMVFPVSYIITRILLSNKGTAKLIGA